jgi:hypothetical protein
MKLTAVDYGLPRWGLRACKLRHCINLDRVLIRVYLRLMASVSVSFSVLKTFVRTLEPLWKYRLGCLRTELMLVASLCEFT